MELMSVSRINKFIKPIAVLCVLTAIGLSFVSMRVVKDGRPAFSVLSPDSVVFDVFPVYGPDSLIEKYRAEVFTPVCNDTTCYPVDIRLFWDLTGRFIQYELPEGSLLTKLDHEPFTEADHRKLFALLKNENPSFVGMSKDDLIGKVVEGTVDAMSGATVQAVKEEVVHGAVYSCYTIWNIVHGRVCDSIRAYTAKVMDVRLAKKLMNQRDPEVQSYLINAMNPDLYRACRFDILQIIKHSGGYWAQRAMERMPDDLIADCEYQDSLSTIYPMLDYYAQRTFLKRVGESLCSELLGYAMVNNLEDRNTGNVSLVLRTLCSMKDKPDSDLFEFLLKKLRKRESALPKEDMDLLAPCVSSKYRKHWRALRRTNSRHRTN